jgi:hypothetical protein
MPRGTVVQIGGYAVGSSSQFGRGDTMMTIVEIFASNLTTGVYVLGSAAFLAAYAIIVAYAVTQPDTRSQKTLAFPH